MPVFADLLHAGSEKYGFMMSAVGLGSLVGVFGIASLGNFRRKGLVLIGAGGLFGLFLVLFGNTVQMNLGDDACYVALIALFVVGMSAISYTATSLTIIQMYVSDEYRGRVTSMYQIVIALYPFSILASSAVAQAIGAPMALTIGGGCLAIFMIIMAIFNKRVRSME
jgi:MFS family permease